MLALKKKNTKKGFTLVEIIVVLVILAILAAIMIPSMTGWIDKAQEKSSIVEARTMLLAAQSVASEEYATAKGGPIEVTETEMEKYADVGASLKSIVVDADNGRVTNMEIVSSDDYTVTYDGSTFTAVKN